METHLRNSPLASKRFNAETAQKRTGYKEPREACRDSDSDASLYAAVNTDIDTDTDIDPDISTDIDTTTDCDSPAPRRPQTRCQSARPWNDKRTLGEDGDEYGTRPKDRLPHAAAPSARDTASHSNDGGNLSAIDDGDDDDELFSPSRVDQLVASFWSKVDQKIDAAISSRQEQHDAPSAADETGSSGAQPPTTEEKGEEEEEKKDVSRACAGISVLFVYIFQALGRIFTLCTEKAKDSSKKCFTAGSASNCRDDVKLLLTHRYTQLFIVMLTVFDFVLVIANILVDFHAIDGRGMEDLFSGFLEVNVAILFLFVFETLTKMIVFRRDLFWDVMETFDTILVAFYFLAEAIASSGFRNIAAPYAEYLHVVVVLRLWRVCFLLDELQQIREEDYLQDIESQRLPKQEG